MGATCSDSGSVSARSPRTPRWDGAPERVFMAAERPFPPVPFWTERSPKAWAPSAWFTVCARCLTVLTNPGGPMLGGSRPRSTGLHANGQALRTDRPLLGARRKTPAPSGRCQTPPSQHGLPRLPDDKSQPVPAHPQHAASPPPSAVRFPPQHSAQTNGRAPRSSCVACPPPGPPERTHGR